MQSVIANKYSDIADKQAFFSRLIQQSGITIWNVLKRCKFLKTSDYNDCMQEIYLAAWKNFDYYLERSNEYEFGVWLNLTGRKAVCRYYARLLGVSSKKPELLYKRKFVDFEIERLCDIAEVEYDESELHYLQRAIDSLPDRDKTVIKKYLEGENLTQWSINENKHENHYSWRVSRIRNVLRETLTTYIDYRTFSKPVSVMSRSQGKGADNPLSKPVIQVDLNGEIVKKWVSAQEASQLGGYSFKGISSVLTKKNKTYAGYTWFHANTSMDEVKAYLESISGIRIKKSTKVLQLNLDGHPVKEYPSLCKVQDAGFSRHGVAKAICNGNMYHSFYWKEIEQLVPAV